MKYSPSYEDVSHCSICAELSDRDGTQMSAALSWHGVNSVVSVKTNEFAAIPSLGPLVLGHHLIVTRRHQLSVMLHAETTGRTAELQTAIERLTSLLSRKLESHMGHSEVGNFVLFEHGSTNDGWSRCGTSHAHLHVVPVVGSALNMIQTRVRNQFCEMNAHEASMQGGLAQDFILSSFICKNRPESKWYFLPAHGVPSQYMRKVVADSLGLGQWDWKVNPESNVLARTLELIVESEGRKAA